MEGCAKVHRRKLEGCATGRGRHTEWAYYHARKLEGVQQKDYDTRDCDNWMGVLRCNGAIWKNALQEEEEDSTRSGHNTMGTRWRGVLRCTGSIWKNALQEEEEDGTRSGHTTMDARWRGVLQEDYDINVRLRNRTYRLGHYLSVILKSKKLGDPTIRWTRHAIV